MESRNTIVEELKALYPAVANLERKNVYSIPLNYFDALPAKILDFVKEQEISVADVPTSAMPFTVPGGYFDSLADSILKKAKQASSKGEVWEELQEVAPFLNSINKQPVYSVPAGYFENFTFKSEFENELNKIAPLLLTISKKQVYKVPEGYFDAFKVTNELFDELQQVAPLLNTISKKEVYTVPQEYFNNFKINIISKATGKLTFLRGTGKVSKIVRYAAAAVIAGVIATGGVLFLNEEQTMEPRKNGDNIASQFKQEQIKTLTDEEIIEYLNANSSTMDATSTPYFDDNGDNSFETYIHEISEEEIKEFLRENEETVIHSKEG